VKRNVKWAVAVMFAVLVLAVGQAAAGDGTMRCQLRRHNGSFESHAGARGVIGDRWGCRAKVVDARHVEVPAWVAAVWCESRVVMRGRWTGWLGDRPVSMTDSTAVYRIVWQAGRWRAAKERR
jgi:hypothetical protein